MKKTNLKYIIFSIIAFVLAIGINVQPVLAASGSVSASGGKTVNIGDTVSITFNVKADVAMYGIEFGVSYDANILEYTGGSNNANGGGGSIKVASGLSSNSASYTLNFKAKQPGNSSISVSNGIGVDEVDEFQLTASGTSVTVAAPVQHSKDNSLKSLIISPGTLSPSFSPSTTKYTATVPSSTTKLVVSAEPGHSAAKVTSVSGGDNLSAGANDVKVVVQAEDGSTATYTITVTREQGASTPTPTPTPTETESIEPTPTPELPPVEVKTDGKSLFINSDFESSSMPESFRKETLEYDGRQISVAVSTDGDLTLVYLTGANTGTGKFYIYNKDTDTFSEYNELESRGGRYIILPLDEEITIPDYFIETSFTMNGKEITGWQLNGLEDEEYYIVYAIDGRGNKDLYNVDLLGGTFQRFSTDAMNTLLSGSASDKDILALQANIESLQDDLDKSNDNLLNLQNKLNTDMSSRLKIIVALIALSLILLIILVNVLLRNKFLKADLAEAEGYNDDNDLLDKDEYEELASRESLTSSDNDNDWTKEYAATEDDYYFEGESDDSFNNYEEPIPNVQVQDYTNTSELQDEEIKPEEIKPEEIKPEEADESLINQDKKGVKTTDLENASLEDIFEYLNVDDLDDDDLD